eukprot:3869356-Pleurochrysis_carterae.AAC.1
MSRPGSVCHAPEQICTCSLLHFCKQRLQPCGTSTSDSDLELPSGARCEVARDEPPREAACAIDHDVQRAPVRRGHPRGGEGARGDVGSGLSGARCPVASRRASDTE